MLDTAFGREQIASMSSERGAATRRDPFALAVHGCSTKTRSVAMPINIGARITSALGSSGGAAATRHDAHRSLMK